MTNEELKKKIIEILEETEYEWTEEKNGYILQIFYDKLADALITAGYGDTKATAKEAVTGFQANLTKWLAKQYRESSTVEITAVFDKIEELLEETK